MGISRDIVGWTAGTESRVEHLYAPHTKWDKLTKISSKLPDRFSLPIDDLLEQLMAIRSRFRFEPILVNPDKGKKRRTYRGIGLTSRTGSEDRLYEASRYFEPSGRLVSSAKSMGIAGVDRPDAKKVDFEREFSNTNEVAPELVRKIREKFSAWTLTKVRLMELHPEGRVAPHFDHPYYDQIRLHYVIESNSDVFWEVEGTQFQIPADGALYWFDTGRIHSVYNFGKTVRTVLSLHLCRNETHSVCESAKDFEEQLIAGSF